MVWSALGSLVPTGGFFVCGHGSSPPAVSSGYALEERLDFVEIDTEVSHEGFVDGPAFPAVAGAATRPNVP
jgi:hypothetical protein